MNILDIVGPVMVGPSSSHTAGAVRIGQTVGKLLGERVVNAKIGLHGSFLATGRGHGTDRAIVAGLLGLAVDDPRIPESFAEAKKAGLSFSFEGISLMNAHPNSVRLEVTGESGRKLEVIGASIGEAPTLVVYNQDKPGCIVKVTSRLGEAGINIATMQVYRDERGGHAVMVIEVDQEVPRERIAALEQEEGIEKVIYLCLEE